MGGLELERPKLAVVPIEEEKVVVVIEVADEIPQDRGLEMEAPVKVKSGDKKVS